MCGDGMRIDAFVYAVLQHRFDWLGASTDAQNDLSKDGFK
jgi:hypothetical protein